MLNVEACALLHNYCKEENIIKLINTLDEST